MNPRIRVKSRILILDKSLFLLAVLITGIMLMIAVNLLPYIVQNTLVQMLKNYNDTLAIILEVAVSFCILIVGGSSFFAFDMGIDRYFLRLAQSENANFSDIFYYFSFKRIFKLTYFSLRVFLIRAIVFVFCQIPALFMIALLLILLQNSISALVLAVLSVSSVVIFISGIVFYKLISSSLFLMKYYYISAKYLNFSHALASSQQAMQSEASNVFKMTLSFSAWFCSCISIAPISYVWSYYKQSKAVMANLIMGK